MRYRPEIDGLRAVAVLAVVLFHAGVPGFRGGYIGVDVFFVISGFLITSISLHLHAEGRFTVAGFFEKRARRILPALLCVSLVTSLAALLVLDPLAITRFFESVIAAQGFVSNLYFLSQSGYFDAEADLKPMLHTWSLGVEEQYYLLFPLVFLVLLRLPKRLAAGIVALLFLASLVAAQVLIELHFKDAAFYLLPTRAWQILVGVAGALIVQNGLAAKATPRAAGSLALAGLALIIVSILVFNNNTPSPGAHALVPTVGAGLLLVFAAKGNLCGRLLALPPLRFAGLISFSLYLWHQPVLALARTRFGEPLSAAAIAVLLLLVVLLSVASWWLVEQRFRRAALVPLPRFVPLAALASLAVITFAAAGMQTHGFLRLVYPPAEADRYATVLRSVDVAFDDTMRDDGACRFSSKQITPEFLDRFDACAARFGKALVVLGDSHGKNFYNLVAETNVSPFTVGAVLEGCRPQRHDPTCQYDDFLEFARKRSADMARVLYHQSGSHLTRPRRDGEPLRLDDGDFQRVVDYLDTLSRDSGLDVTWVGPFSEFRKDPVRASTEPALMVLPAETRAMLDLVDSRARELLSGSPVTYLPFSQLYAFPDSVLTGDCLMYRDPDHLSRCGETMIAAEMVASGRDRLLTRR